MTTGQEGWRSLPLGGVIREPGGSVNYETGGWRAHRPVVDLARCTHCMFCWVFCPDGSVTVENTRLVGFDLAHCKGCGICAKECPTHCIKMVEETFGGEEENR